MWHQLAGFCHSLFCCSCCCLVAMGLSAAQLMLLSPLLFYSSCFYPPTAAAALLQPFLLCYSCSCSTAAASAPPHLLQLCCSLSVMIQPACNTQPIISATIALALLQPFLPCFGRLQTHSQLNFHGAFTPVSPFTQLQPTPSATALSVSAVLICVVYAQFNSCNRCSSATALFSSALHTGIAAPGLLFAEPLHFFVSGLA